ncbi:uncharacterized protein LOC101860870 [Aplysia californica]|uniref:Uncharacterized protein LOC101860870 n=1 Tax=Aplysia californica TaxID=6500 RepID=A0ABM0K9X0_APLCA|nr:uncharacterized protein LOC101860870 [Aplysia californica]
MSDSETVSYVSESVLGSDCDDLHESFPAFNCGNGSPVVPDQGCVNFTKDSGNLNEVPLDCSVLDQPKIENVNTSVQVFRSSASESFHLEEGCSKFVQESSSPQTVPTSHTQTGGHPDSHTVCSESFKGTVADGRDVIPNRRKSFDHLGLSITNLTDDIDGTDIGTLSLKDQMEVSRPSDCGRGLQSNISNLSVVHDSSVPSTRVGVEQADSICLEYDTQHPATSPAGSQEPRDKILLQHHDVGTIDKETVNSSARKQDLKVQGSWLKAKQSPQQLAVSPQTSQEEQASPLLLVPLHHKKKPRSFCEQTARENVTTGDKYSLVCEPSSGAADGPPWPHKPFSHDCGLGDSGRGSRGPHQTSVWPNKDSLYTEGSTVPPDERTKTSLTSAVDDKKCSVNQMKESQYLRSLLKLYEGYLGRPESFPQCTASQLLHYEGRLRKLNSRHEQEKCRLVHLSRKQGVSAAEKGKLRDRTRELKGRHWLLGQVVNTHKQVKQRLKSASTKPDPQTETHQAMNSQREVCDNQGSEDLFCTQDGEDGKIYDSLRGASQDLFPVSSQMKVCLQELPEDMGDRAWKRRRTVADEGESGMGKSVSAVSSVDGSLSERPPTRAENRMLPLSYQRQQIEDTSTTMTVNKSLSVGGSNSERERFSQSSLPCDFFDPARLVVPQVRHFTSQRSLLEQAGGGIVDSSGLQSEPFPSQKAAVTSVSNVTRQTPTQVDGNLTRSVVLQSIVTPATAASTRSYNTTQTVPATFSKTTTQTVPATFSKTTTRTANATSLSLPLAASTTPSTHQGLYVPTQTETVALKVSLVSEPTATKVSLLKDRTAVAPDSHTLKVEARAVLPAGKGSFTCSEKDISILNGWSQASLGNSQIFASKNPQASATSCRPKTIIVVRKGNLEQNLENKPSVSQTVEMRRAADYAEDRQSVTANTGDEIHDLDRIVKNLRRVKVISNSEVTTSSPDFPEEFWLSKFSDVAMTPEFWQEVDAW